MLRKGLQTTLSFWDKLNPEFLFEEAALFLIKIIFLIKDVGYSKSWDLKNVESYGSRNESKSGIK